MKTIKIRRGKREIKKLLNIIGELNCYIMGGFAKYACSPKIPKAGTISDIDIYCENQSSFEILRKRLNDAGFKEHEKDHIVCIMFLKNNPLNMPIQLIKPITDFNLVTEGSIEDIIQNFDFTVARIGILNEREAICDDDFSEHEKRKLLVIKNIHCPISSSIRMMKYAKKGYHIRPREVYKLFVDWDSRDANYRISIASLFTKSDDGTITDNEIEHLERLLRRD